MKTLINAGPLGQHETIAEKLAAFKESGKNNGFAYKSDGARVLLTDVNVESVAFWSGLWRVQNKFDEKIVHVRDAEFVLDAKMPVGRKQLKCHKATMLGDNCYGKYKSMSNYIVINYFDHWSYGPTFHKAYEELSEELFDKNIDEIHKMMCRFRQK